MQKIDVNCLFGSWPFRKMYHGALCDLEKVHTKNEISRGYISSLQSIFYNDPMEAEEDLHEAIKGTNYQQIFTVNPTLPSFAENIADAVENFQIAGVRIYPGYHDFKLNDPCMKDLHVVLSRFHLPLFVAVRVEDERTNYLITPRVIPMDELRTLADEFTDVNILFTGIMSYEAVDIKDTLNNKPNIFVETSYFKSPTGCMEEALAHISDEKILYGSAYPFNCLKSSLFDVETADISQESKAKVLSENTIRFFNCKTK